MLGSSQVRTKLSESGIRGASGCKGVRSGPRIAFGVLKGFKEGEHKVRLRKQLGGSNMS